jgi:hypothetical protein
MARHQLIDDYLKALARQLPADAVDELADGLIETWQQHRAAGLSPDVAARAAIAEFGDAEQLIGAFIRNGPARRTARQLLATGPLVGLCWATALISAHAWAWPIPTGARAAFGVALVATIAALVTAARSEHRYTRTRRSATSAAIALIGLDTLMLGGVLILAPALAWPMAIAAPVSLTRIGFTIRALPRLLAT